MINTHTHTYTHRCAVCALPVVSSAFVHQTAGSDEGELPSDSREPKDEEEQDERKDQEEDDEQSRSNWVRLWREGAFTQAGWLDTCRMQHVLLSLINA